MPANHIWARVRAWCTVCGLKCEQRCVLCRKALHRLGEGGKPTECATTHYSEIHGEKPVDPAEVGR